MAATNFVDRGDRTVRTHQGGIAYVGADFEQLQRMVLTCLLWENTFYMNGRQITEIISDLIGRCDPAKVATLTKVARTSMNLRHVPLFMAIKMLGHPEHKRYVEDVLKTVVQRPDEIGETLALYWSKCRTQQIPAKKFPIAAQVKRGLRSCFEKFDAYQLSKWDRATDAIKLKYAMTLLHPKPKTEDMAIMWNKLMAGTLEPAYTIEMLLSTKDGRSQKEKYEEYLRSGRYAAGALLGRIRHMIENDVNKNLIADAWNKTNFGKMFPFRFITAAKHAPTMEPLIEQAMMKSLERIPGMLEGHTTLLVDVSGSMNWPLSQSPARRYSTSNVQETVRIDAACGLALLLREKCEDVTITTFSNDLVTVPPRRGFALRDAIKNSQAHRDTFLAKAINSVKKTDRLIVITDEQSRDNVGDPPCEKAYMMNVASYQYGVGTGNWTRISGWSDQLVRYIIAIENMNAGKGIPQLDIDENEE